MAESKDFVIENGVLTKYQGRKTKVVISDDVNVIGDYAFRYSKVKSVTMSKNIREIGNGAFYDCDNLETVDFSDSIVKIGSGAFEGCRYLSKIVLPEKLQYIGEGAFRNCYWMKELNFPEPVTSIGKEAFYGTFFEKYILGDNIIEIGECAFDSNKNLQHRLFANLNSKTGETLNAMYITYSEKPLNDMPFKIEVTEDNAGSFDWYNDGFCKRIEAIELKEGLKQLKTLAFRNLSNIEELIFPDSFESLSVGLIPNGYDYKLKKVHFGKGLKTISHLDKNYFGFEHIPHLSDLSLLKDVETVTIDPDNRYFKIENDLFLSKDGTILYAYIGKGCKELTIPKTVKKIKGHAFNSCYKIDKLIVPGTVKTIDPAFVFSRIGDLIFEEGVKEISDNAFLNSYIENIKFPKSLKKFGKHPFINACKLKILRLYDGIEYYYAPMLGSMLGNASDSAFWFNPDGHFNDLEFIEIYDKNDNLLRRYGLITDKEKNTGNWLQNYHEHLFYSIYGWEWRYNSKASSIEDSYVKSPLNYSYIKDWQHFKDAVTKNRFICGILPELDNINEDLKDVFLDYISKNKANIYNMAKEYNFTNVIEILDKI